MAMNKGYIRTFTGKRVYPLDPKQDQINMMDIAWHLAHVNRYTGAASKSCNVAAHSIAVMSLVRSRGGDLGTQYAALLHDASEAYLADVAAPVKDDPRFEFYREAEKRLQDVIENALKVPALIDCTLIRESDAEIFRAEWPVFMGAAEEGIAPPLELTRIVFNSVSANYDDAPEVVFTTFLNHARYFMRELGQ